MTTQSLADRLEHAIATASNDDYSKVGTRERDRHVERIGVMQDCLASLRQSGEAIERAAKAAEEAENALNFLFSRLLKPTHLGTKQRYERCREIIICALKPELPR